MQYSTTLKFTEVLSALNYIKEATRILTHTVSFTPWKMLVQFQTFLSKLKLQLWNSLS